MIKHTSKILLTVASTAVACMLSALSYNGVLSIGDNLVKISDIDSLTFEKRNGVIHQLLWKNGQYSSYIAEIGSSLYYINIENLNDTIYKFAIDDCRNPWDNNYDCSWDSVYVTPIGYFFFSRYNSILDDVFDDDTDGWYYESFDGKHWAWINAFSSDLTISHLEHRSGQVDAEYMEESLFITHIVNDEVTETDIEDLILDTGSDSNRGDLLFMVKMFCAEFAKYECIDIDPEFTLLHERFQTILQMPVSSSLPPDNNIRKKNEETKDKVTKRKFHSSIYTIRYDCGEYIPLYSKAAIFTFDVKSRGPLYKIEYGILIDQCPDSLTYDKADIRITNRQMARVNPLNTPYNRRYMVGITDSLEIDTKYYYTVFVKIPNNQKGAFKFRYGDRSKTEAYGEVKHFTTAKRYRVNATFVLDYRGLHQEIKIPEFEAEGEIGCLRPIVGHPVYDGGRISDINSVIENFWRNYRLHLSYSRDLTNPIPENCCLNIYGPNTINQCKSHLCVNLNNNNGNREDISSMDFTIGITSEHHHSPNGIYKGGVVQASLYYKLDLNRDSFAYYYSYSNFMTYIEYVPDYPNGWDQCMGINYAVSSNRITGENNITNYGGTGIWAKYLPINTISFTDLKADVVLTDISHEEIQE